MLVTDRIRQKTERRKLQRSFEKCFCVFNFTEDVRSRLSSVRIITCKRQPSLFIFFSNQSDFLVIFEQFSSFQFLDWLLPHPVAVQSLSQLQTSH